MKHRIDLCPAIYLAFILVFGVARANAQVTYTCDPSVATSTCNYLNTVVSGYYSNTFLNANASIYITYGKTGLGQSISIDNYIPYTQYVAALSANTKPSPVQAAALSSLNTNAAGPYGAGNINVSAALGQALGLSISSGIMSDGSTDCTLGTQGCYNSVVTITNDPSIPLYYDDQGGPEPPDAYDFYATVQHETDEVLGTSSCISTADSSVQPAVDGRTALVKRVIRTSALTHSAAKAILTDGCAAGGGPGTPSAVDLFRYSGAGTLVLDSSLSTAPGAYFSYDGGVTKGADGVDGAGKDYNTKANGDDYADFTSSDDCGTAEAIQDGEGCPGEDAGLTILNDGKGEITILNAIGYNLVAPTTPQSVNPNKKLIDFGQVMYQPTTNTKQDGLDLENDGSTGVLIATISVAGTYGDASQFTFNQNKCFALDPGKKCHIDVSFTPDAVQISRATLLIPTSTASGSSTISIPLTGAGILNVSQ